MIHRNICRRDISKCFDMIHRNICRFDISKARYSDTIHRKIDIPIWHLETFHTTSNTTHKTHLHGLDGSLEVGRDRLLAEDVLARLGGGLDLVGVELRGGAHPHRLHVRVVDHLHPLHILRWERIQTKMRQNSTTNHNRVKSIDTVLAEHRYETPVWITTA